MMDGVLNLIRREVGRVMSRLATPKCGTVTAYDPATYSAKVLLHPEEVETGWLPVRTPWSGNGWGMFCPPTPGDEVEIQFQEGGKQAPYIALRAFGDRFRPLAVPSGEFWLVDKLGNSFKFSGGKVLVNGHTEIDVTTPTLNITSSASVNVTTPTMNLNGNLNVTGNIVASGDITDLSSGVGTTMARIRSVYDGHSHGGTQPGGSNTAPPNQLL